MRNLHYVVALSLWHREIPCVYLGETCNMDRGELPPLARGAEVEASPLLRVLRSLVGVVLDLISILERILNVTIGKPQLEQAREPRVHSRHYYTLAEASRLQYSL